MDRQLLLIKCHSQFLLKELIESIHRLCDDRDKDDDGLMELAEDLPSNIEALEVSNKSIYDLLNK